MTKLIVTPIDMDAPGSHKERKRVFKALSGYGEVLKTKDIGAVVQAWEALEVILPKYLSTDDESDPMAAFEDISGNQFDELSVGLLGAKPAVPEAKSAN